MSARGMSNATHGLLVRDLHNSSPQKDLSWLLLLPEAALALVLQKLLRQDPYSLFRLAKSCIRLRDDVPAYACIGKISLSCRRPGRFDNFTHWLEQHNTNLTYLRECTINFSWDEAKKIIGRLPCPQLRQLNLERVTLHSDVAGGCPSVLEDCTGLTALSLSNCKVSDMHAVFAVLPELQHIKVGGFMNKPEHTLDLADLPHPFKIKKLGLKHPPKQAEQLSALVNLQHLSLQSFPPGGVPPQLTNLTFLHLGYSRSVDAAGPLEHLSTFRTLQELEVDCFCYPDTADLAGDLSGIVHLTKLTRLALKSSTLDFSAIRTYSWARLTALESLSLQECAVQRAALAAFTQLRALRFSTTEVLDGATSEELVAAVSKLLRLTELHAVVHGPVPPAAFTALTASTNLCDLRLTLFTTEPSCKCVLFRPDTTYLHLRHIDLAQRSSQQLRLSGQQLELLCSCCPALESLRFDLCSQASPTECLSLRQLTKLTYLRVCKLSRPDPQADSDSYLNAGSGLESDSESESDSKSKPGSETEADLGSKSKAESETLAESGSVAEAESQSDSKSKSGSESDSNSAAAAADAVVDAVAQLTGLQQLSLRDLPSLTNPRLLQLTALTALVDLKMSGTVSWHMWTHDETRYSTPDVWSKLLFHLLHDKTCRQALLKRSTEPVATPAEGRRLQFAVEVAEMFPADASRQHPSTQYLQLVPSLTLGCGIPEA